MILGDSFAISGEGFVVDIALSLCMGKAEPFLVLPYDNPLSLLYSVLGLILKFTVVSSQVLTPTFLMPSL